MSFTAFNALVRRDLHLFFTDRRAVTMSFVAPILIASFFGYIFGGVTNEAAPSKIRVAAVDQDGSGMSHKLVAALSGDKALEVTAQPLDEARAGVKVGHTVVAAVIPKGFEDQAARAFLRGGVDKPEIQLLYDPSHGPELAMVNGLLTQHVMEVVSSEVFAGQNSQKYLDNGLRELQQAQGIDPASKRALQQLLGAVGQLNAGARTNPQGAAAGGFSMPYTVKQEAVTARRGQVYNGMAHSFAGMSVQFILFMGIDAGLLVLMQRRSGIWTRMRAAPLSRFVIIGSRAASAATIAMVILCVVFSFARVVFHVRIEGSMPGFLLVCFAFAIMTAAFGLLVAVLGKTPEATRGLAILVTLILVMLGGSWVPAFLFPQWLQNASFAVPTRWAVDGLDGMIWRGLGFDAALAPVAAMLGFAALFGGLALWRFRWDTPG
jgi:ABC-2 type transport system permease protein